MPYGENRGSIECKEPAACESSRHNIRLDIGPAAFRSGKVIKPRKSRSVSNHEKKLFEFFDDDTSVVTTEPKTVT